MFYNDQQAEEVIKLVQEYPRITDVKLSQNELSCLSTNWGTLTNLVKLDLSNNEEMSGDIASLRELRNLAHLYLSDTQVSGDKEALQSELPNCGIYL